MYKRRFAEPSNSLLKTRDASEEMADTLVVSVLEIDH